MQNRKLLVQLEKWLFKNKALVLIGARQVGKSTLVNQLLKKVNKPSLYLNADETPVRKLFAEVSVASLKKIIGKYKIIVIDEVQRIENAGLLLKLMVDNFKNVQVIATGSSSLDISETIFEPLTGRHFLFNLYPFTLSELYPKKSAFEIEQQLPFHLIYGSYPDVCNHRDDAEMYLKNLTAQYLYKDVLVWKDIRKPDLLDKLLQLLAYQMGQEVSLNELASQLKVKSETVDSYIDLLEKSFVIYRLKAYSTNERKEVSKMKKILFWDNGIRNALIGDFRPSEQRNDAGLLWENFIISERIKMNSYLQKNTKSYFWRSLQQQEVDYVEISNKNISAFEMKWNSHKKNYVTKAFTNLYPASKTEIIQPTNFEGFCYL